MLKDYPKKLIIYHIFIIILGVVLMLLGLKTLVTGIIVKSSTFKVEAVVLNIIEDEDERYVNIKYSVGDEDFSGRLPYFSKDLDIGDNVTVRINKDNYEDIYSNGNYWVSVVILLVASLLILSFKSIEFVNLFKDDKRITKLLEGNKIIEGTIISVEENKAKRFLMMTPVRIVCEVKNKVIFSHNIYINGDITSYAGKKVNIYFEDEELNNYYINYKEVKNG